MDNLDLLLRDISAGNFRFYDYLTSKRGVQQPRRLKSSFKG